MSYSNYEQTVIIDGHKLLGIQGVDGSYGIKEKQINVAGVGFVDALPDGPLEGNFSISRKMVSKDPLLELDQYGRYIYDEKEISGVILYDDDTKGFGFTKGRLSNYTVSCSVGNIPDIQTEIRVYGSLGKNVSSSLKDQVFVPPTIAFPDQSSIKLVVSDFTVDAIVDFSYSRSINLLPLYVLNRGSLVDWNSQDPFQGVVAEPIQVDTQYPIETDITFTMIANEYEIREIKDRLQSAPKSTLEIQIYDSQNPDVIINSFRAKNARLISENINSTIDQEMNISLSYKSYESIHAYGQRQGVVFDSSGIASYQLPAEINVAVVDDNYAFNGISSDGNSFVLNTGTYVFKNVPEEFAINFSSTSDSVYFSGDNFHARANSSGKVLDYYYGDVILNIVSEFTSIDCSSINTLIQDKESVIVFSSDAPVYPDRTFKFDVTLATDKNNFELTENTWNEINAAFDEFARFILTLDKKFPIVLDFETGSRWGGAYNLGGQFNQETLINASTNGSITINKNIFGGERNIQHVKPLMIHEILHALGFSSSRVGIMPAYRKYDAPYGPTFDLISVAAGGYMLTLRQNNDAALPDIFSDVIRRDILWIGSELEFKKGEDFSEIARIQYFRSYALQSIDDDRLSITIQVSGTGGVVPDSFENGFQLRFWQDELEQIVFVLTSEDLGGGQFSITLKSSLSQGFNAGDAYCRLGQTLENGDLLIPLGSPLQETYNPLSQAAIRLLSFRVADFENDPFYNDFIIHDEYNLPRYNGRLGVLQYNQLSGLNLSVEQGIAVSSQMYVTNVTNYVSLTDFANFNRFEDNLSAEDPWVSVFAKKQKQEIVEFGITQEHLDYGYYVNNLGYGRERMFLSQAVNIGSTQIHIGSSRTDGYYGGLSITVGRDDQAETVTIDSINGSLINLQSALQKDHDSGSIVYRPSDESTIAWDDISTHRSLQNIVLEMDPSDNVGDTYSFARAYVFQSHLPEYRFDHWTDANQDGIFLDQYGARIYDRDIISQYVSASEDPQFLGGIGLGLIADFGVHNVDLSWVHNHTQIPN